MTPCPDSEHQWVTFAQLLAYGGLTQFQRCKKCGEKRAHHPDEPWLDDDEDYEEGCE